MQSSSMSLNTRLELAVMGTEATTSDVLMMLMYADARSLIASSFL